MIVAEFTIQIEGPGMTLKREVEEPIVLRMLAILLGTKAQNMFTSDSGSQASVAPPAVTGNVGESPREYLERSGAKTNPAKITAFGLYLRAQGTEAFTTRNVRDQFVAAGDTAPRNLSRDVKDTVRLGWLASRPDQPDTYYVTRKGEQAATAGFSERSAVPRRSSRSTGNGTTSEGSPSPSAP